MNGNIWQYKHIFMHFPSNFRFLICPSFRHQVSQTLSTFLEMQLIPAWLMQTAVASQFYFYGVLEELN